MAGSSSGAMGAPRLIMSRTVSSHSALVKRERVIWPASWQRVHLARTRSAPGTPATRASGPVFPAKAGYERAVHHTIAP